MQKSFMANKDNVVRGAYLIDAENKILGRVATKAADLLRGKHKPTFTPHTDCGDNVIIINAEKVRVTGKKLDQKIYQRYSGYPSGQTDVKLKVMLEKSPTVVLEHAVFGMIPKGALGNKIKTKLRVYAGKEHPHQAQKPVLMEI